MSINNQINSGSTDQAWEAWGQKDPYFGVITNQKFRRTELTKETKAEFFESGRLHAEYVMQMIHQYIDPAFQAQKALDFGCGVGRLIVPLAKMVTSVVGADVSPSMLLEAEKNCVEADLQNVRLVQSDDALSVLDERFDFIHSFIVFQHIPPQRGREIFAALLARLDAGGVGAVHFAYSKDHYAPTHGLPPTPAVINDKPAKTEAKAVAQDPNADPEIQMNPYHLNELFFLLQINGVHRFHTEFTDHGGELGVFLYFQKPRA